MLGVLLTILKSLQVSNSDFVNFKKKNEKVSRLVCDQNNKEFDRSIIHTDGTRTESFVN